MKSRIKTPKTKFVCIGVSQLVSLYACFCGCVACVDGGFRHHYRRQCKIHLHCRHKHIHIHIQYRTSSQQTITEPTLCMTPQGCLLFEFEGHFERGTVILECE